MLIEFTCCALVGERSYLPGEVAEVSDGTAHRLIRGGVASIPVEVLDVEEIVALAPSMVLPTPSFADTGKRKKA